MSTKFGRQETIEFDEWLETLPDEFLECRDIRHQWGGALMTWMLGHGFRGRVLTCRRCGATKDQVLSKEGHVVVNRMNYPTDYQKTRNLPRGRVPTKVLREVVGGHSKAKGKPPEQITAIFSAITGGG